MPVAATDNSLALRAGNLRAPAIAGWCCDAKGPLRFPARAWPKLVRRRRDACQYNFFGSCMLRTRLKCRLTAAAFLRLRSEVGFS